MHVPVTRPEHPVTRRPTPVARLLDPVARHGARLVLAAVLVAAGAIAVPVTAPPAAATPAVPAPAAVPLTTSDVTTGGECDVNGRRADCRVGVDVPGSGGGGGGGGTGGGGAVTCVNAGGNEVPCTLNGAWWSSQYNCYLSLLDPQPPLTDAVWEGNTDGGIYRCSLPNTGADILHWVPEQAVPVDPAVAAQRAVASLGLQAIEIGIVPEPGPDSVGLVGLPTWMWVDQPSDTTWGPMSTTASVGGVSVTATAQVQRVDWDMGDGTVVACETPGTPYHDSAGDAPSPDCGHVYERTSVGEPGDAFDVSATTYWSVEWAGGGGSGSLSFDFTSETEIRVGELQVLVD